ncbi:MAG: ABC transporter permease [Oscillospiraceae bacterium]|nr:ABC transporter permease [Oscillospiraceae bacterium]
MLSVTSLFNASLMRRNFRRFWPIWAVYTIIWLVMMPIVMALEFSITLQNGNTLISSSYTYLDMVLNYSAETQVALNACVGVLLAMAVFSYLCTARSVGMMHSLPISRKSLFATNYASGLGMLCSTYLITFLATGLVEASFGVLQLGDLWQWLWVCCGTGFFCYSFGVLCAVFAGQVLAVPVFYVILNFVAVAMYYLLDSFAAIFRFGANGSALRFESEITWFSPLFRLLRDLRVRGDWMDDGENYVRHLQGQSTVLIYIAVGAVLTLFAYAAYLRRKSESASDVVAVTWAKPVFKYGVAFCMAFTVGLGMYHLFIKSFLPGYNNSIFGAVVCLVVAGVIGYYIAEMLLQKSFKVLKKGRKGALVAAVGIAAISLVLTLDITGYDTYLPDRAEVKGARAYISGSNFYMEYNGTDADALDDIYALHAAIIANRDELRDRAADWTYGRRDELQYCYVDIEYYCENENGEYTESVERRYEVYCLDEELNTPATVGFAIADFVFNENVYTQQLLNHDPTNVSAVLGGRFEYMDTENDDYVWQQVNLTEAQAKALYNALLADADMLTMKRANTFEELNLGLVNKECNITFYLVNLNGDSYDAYVSLYAGAEKTIETLYTAGILAPGTQIAQWSDRTGSYEVITHEVTIDAES